MKSRALLRGVATQIQTFHLLSMPQWRLMEEFLRERSGAMISALQNDGKLCFPFEMVPFQMMVPIAQNRIVGGNPFTRTCLDPLGYCTTSF